MENTMNKVTSTVIGDDLIVYLDDSLDAFYMTVGTSVTRSYNIESVDKDVFSKNESIADNANMLWLDNFAKHGAVKTGYMVAEFLKKVQKYLTVPDDVAGTITQSSQDIAEGRDVIRHACRILAHDVNGYTEWNDGAKKAHQAYVKNPCAVTYKSVQNYF